VLVLVATSRPVGAQDSARRTDSQWLQDVTRYYAAALKLPDLATAPRRGIMHELRIWTGFGLTGTALLVLSETPKGWTGTDYYPVGWKQKPKRQRLPADSAKALWDAALSAGLLDLPAEAPRSPLTHVNDGFSVLIEWVDSTRTGTSAAAHPDHYCTPGDLRILAVTKVLLGRYAPQCATQ
jgi:hypothetical protein